MWLPTAALAQQNPALPAIPENPTPPPAPAAASPEELKWNLNSDGSRYWKITFLNQAWVRFNQSNPGTTVIGAPKDNTFDIGLRRTRIQMYGKVARRTFLYFQFGQNNFNFASAYAAGASTNRKPQAFFHDAVAEFEVFENKDWLKIGGGLTIANGLSRFSQPSIGTIMTMDVPVFAQATVDQTDQFSRKLSIYARGQVGKIDYRFSYSDPFPVSTNGNPLPALGKNSSFALKGHTQQLQAYLMYQFLENEPNTTPYMAGTYLGKKRIFNIAGGLIHQNNATWHTGATTGDTSYSAMNLWAVECFLDIPLNKDKGTAFNAYAGFFNTSYGPGYLRFNGVMNPATGSSLIGGNGTQGNAFPMFGNGTAFYAQAGYLCPTNMLGESLGTLMPYASFQNGNYQRLNAPSKVFNAGVNWLVSGSHKSKITLNYENRSAYTPDGTSGNFKFDSRKSGVVVQYQVFI
ncbi:MAG: hypothetical protein V4543_17695 [Bacteroidota bacterium]